MKSLRRVVYFVKLYWRASFLALALFMGVAFLDLLIPYLTQRVIDYGIARQDMNVIVTTALAMIGTSVLSAAFSIGNTVLAVQVSHNVGADLRSAIVRKVQTFSFGNLDRLQTGQLIVRATSDVNQVLMMVMMSLRMLIRAPLWMVGSLVMLLLITPQLAALMLFLLPAVLCLIWFFVHKAQPLFLTVQQKLDWLNQLMQENLAGVRVVKAFVRAEHEKARFDVANRDLMAHTIKVMQLLAFLMPTMMVIINLGIAGAIWFGGKAVIQGSMTMGEIVAGVNYLAFATFPMLILGGMIGPLSAADVSAGRIFEVLDSIPDVPFNLQSDSTLQPQTGANIQGRVAFEGVCFSYAGDCSEPVLWDINLVAEPGQTVALLGATGSGKSSLVHLIPRFYEVRGGRVMVDGVDVRDIPLDTLRAQVGLALQETVLFGGTIRDNIRYGRPDAKEAAVIAAAKAAQAHEFIAAFPDGYDTLIGQRGVTLSGGQKQRIAIARVLLVRPRILVLDDSTSAVDVETEGKIQAALERQSAECTSFIIAQRISTVLNADKIVVLDRGRVAAVGTHAQLMLSSSIYQEIYHSQLGPAPDFDRS